MPMLIPRKLAHRKVCKGRMAGQSTRGFNIDFGEFGLKATTRGWLTSREIEAGRRAITRYVKRGGKIWTRIFPHKPVTKKAAEVGMGGGKGSLDHFVAVVKPGTIIFEIAGVEKDTALEALRLAANKLSVKSKIVSGTVK